MNEWISNIHSIHFQQEANKNEEQNGQKVGEGKYFFQEGKELQRRKRKSIFGQGKYLAREKE